MRTNILPKFRFPNIHISNLNIIHTKERTPFIVYADFESLLLPKGDNVTIGKYQKHEAISTGYYFKCYYDYSSSYYRSHTGVDSMTGFADEMFQLSRDIQARLVNVKS